MPLANAEDLRAFAERVLSAAGLAPDDAQIAAEGLVAANLRGVDTHGVFRLPQYVDTLRRKEVNPRPEVRVVVRRDSTALVDADGGYGFRPSLLAADTAADIARDMGVGVVGVRNSHHFGAAAFYTIRVSNEQMIGIVTTTATPTMAPPGGTRPVVGNNPISCSVPRRPPAPPIVLDMALSQVAFGKIRVAAAEGKPIPTGWAFNREGRPTTDPDEALRAGMLAPVGQHKGYGLSVIAEVLAGVLTRSPFGADADAHSHRSGGVGHLIMCINPAYFLDPSEFYEGVERLVLQIKAVPTASPAETVYLPGEPEWRTFLERREKGVPISSGLAERLEALADELGVSQPPWR